MKSVGEDSGITCCGMKQLVMLRALLNLPAELIGFSDQWV